MPENNEYLVIKNLSKFFGGLGAVQDLNFSLRQGKILGLIGPNGAGKTTVFNLITGFLPPTEGRILWKGRNLVGKKAHQIVKLGIVRTFQLVKPFPDLSLFDNIQVACWGPRFIRKGLNWQDINSRIREVAELVGLPKNLDQMASNLGHGDLRLLDIARALMVEPELFLLDEPLSGLSSIETQKIVGLIKELNDQGITFLIIELKLKDLMKVADHIVAIDFGSKLSEGTPEEIVRDAKVIDAYLGKKETYGAA